MRPISFVAATVFAVTLAALPMSVSASKVGEIIKVKSPPGTIGHIVEQRSDNAQPPYWDTDLPRGNERLH